MHTSVLAPRLVEITPLRASHRVLLKASVVATMAAVGALATLAVLSGSAALAILAGLVTVVATYLATWKAISLMTE
ncbi:hypothetical protein [uncultured Tessaracoccus sp.]|uniref:hypothetical protein n=1 Tax=uncultured Tessaracoccus sp. TaxID=905023 RepID=UPI0025D3331E|nr:hypothetical protein [uncultured Tessaracoccus sp.]